MYNVVQKCEAFSAHSKLERLMEDGDEGDGSGEDTNDFEDYESYTSDLGDNESYTSDFGDNELYTSDLGDNGSYTSDLEDNESSEDGSEYGGGAHELGTGQPPKKKAKGSTTSPVKSSRGHKDLSLLPTMPLDALFEIFSFLHPKDMMSLTRTNKLFRKTLMSRNAITVWKSTFKNTGTPECPKDMTEPQWAALIFGNTCQVCDAKNIQKVDFFLRRRACTKCKKENLVSERKFKIKYPELEISILDLIPHTVVGGCAHGHTSKSPFFWSADIDAMVKKLAQLQHDIHMRRDNAHKRLETFTTSQKEFVKDVLSNAKTYQDHLLSIIQERDAADLRAQTARQNAIRQRFVELGYTEYDIEACSSHGAFLRKKELSESERAWNRIRPLLEPLVLKGKNRRLMIELGKLQEIRRKIVDELYTAYKRTVTPFQWLYLPQTYTICNFSPFAEFIDLPLNAAEVTPANFEEPMRLLPELLSKYWDEKRMLRLRMIPPASDGTSSAPSIDPLQLATSVFECRSYSSLGTIVVGTEGHMTHTCMSPNHGLPCLMFESSDGGECLSFSERGSETARLLVGLAGLDVRTATASDMDNCGVRFSCSSCPVHDFNGVFMRFGYSWRSAILHSFRDHRPGFLWGILSNTETTSMRQVEESEHTANHEIPQWACNRCPESLNQFQARPAVVAHLREVHQISEPKEPGDLFFYDRVRSGPTKVRFPADRSVKPIKSNFLGAKFHCSHCANVSKSAATRLFTDNGLISHLLAKHSVQRQDMREGVDYTRPQLCPPPK